jgi:hypothetical protein
LFEAVRAYSLRGKETLIACASYHGALVGFTVADTKGPAPRWLILRKAVKVAMGASTDEDERGWLRKLLSYQGRRELIPWILGEDDKKKPARRSIGKTIEKAPDPPVKAGLEIEPDVDLSLEEMFDLLDSDD